MTKELNLRVLLMIKELLPKTSQKDNQKLKNLIFDIEKVLQK